MKYRVKSRIWIEADGEILLGEGRVKLLKVIHETGSLSKASKTMGMSYKKAWALVDKINNRAQNPVTQSNVGGKGGGGVMLTEYGLSLIDAFEKLNKRCWDFLDEEVDKMKL